MSVDISTKEIAEFRNYLARLPEVAETSARIAVNDSAGLARRLGSKEIRAQVALPKSYLDANLSITKKASNDDLEANVSGRERPTSLARFAVGTPRFGNAGKRRIQVKVAGNGASKTMPNAFFIKLRSGKNLDSDNYNVGLAVRLKPGERIANKRRMVNFGGGLYLLYGPSVAQVFDDVAVDIEPIVSENLVTEFLRQFDRLSKS